MRIKTITIKIPYAWTTAEALRFINSKAIRLTKLALKTNNDRFLDWLAEKILIYGIRYMSFFYRFDKVAGGFYVPYGGREGDPYFMGKYQFIKYPDSPGRRILVVARFNGRKVKISRTRMSEEEENESHSTTLFFRNGRTIIRNMAGEDMFGLLVEGDFVKGPGSVNYLCKFGYLMNHMKFWEGSWRQPG